MQAKLDLFFQMVTYLIMIGLILCINIRWTPMETENCDYSYFKSFALIVK